MPNNTIRIFDVETKSFPDWQKDFTAQVSKKISTQHDPILGACFSPIPPKPAYVEQSSYQSVILWGANWICRFRIFPKSAGRSSIKRGRNDEDEATEEESGIKETEAIQSGLEKATGGELFMTVFTQYRHLLGVHFLDWDEMVVIERPLLDVLSKLPPAYFKAKYGT
jgi:U3 small nucleolar RNA-associated protein 4